ncbi:type II secretion system protein N [Planctobacterium marinum]|uniref:Type II secretion system protein N n=1 Tax=Planctobacterium marinum TaxID=1631968 RepID=A0AA48HMI8_9ALTE|nr:hypothetical protein MACH26_01100 [Planctobacterium marinum]
MKQQLTLTAGAVILFLVFLLVKLPASQLIPRLPLPADISLKGISGTVWDGHADQVVVKGLGINNVDWQLSFLPLLIGKAALELDAGSARDSEQISIKGDVKLSVSGISAQNLTLFAPTPLLMAQVELPIPVDASGRARINIENFDYHKTDGCSTLTGTGSWLNAGVAGFNGQVQLGNFEASLHCDNGPIEITTAADNSLNLSAKAVVQHNGKFSVNGQFKVSDNLPKEVHDAAKFFGRTDAQGFYQIKL